MADIEDIESWKGAEVLDADGEKVGKLDELYLDARSGDPTYGLVKSGILGRRHVVPLDGAAFSRGHVRISQTKDLVGAAPAVEGEGITYRDQVALNRHYGLGDPAERGDPDQLRFETATVVGARNQAILAEQARADELEAAAAERDAEAARMMSEADDQARRATEVGAERDRLLAEAAEARARAESD